MKQASKQVLTVAAKAFAYLLFHVSGTEVVKKQFDSEVDGHLVSIGVSLQNAGLGSLYRNALCSENIQHTITH